MKSSPKINEISPSIEPKTPASAKKLVQARLPFKTLGGCEPLSNDAPDTSSDSPNTSSPAIENRKRKQITTTQNDNSVRAAKVNRCEQANNDDITSFGTTESMQSDLLVDSDTNNGTKALHNKNSGSKENCKEIVDKVESANCNPKAKHSLEFSGEQPEPRKSKRNETSFMIKLPINKKTKKTKKSKMSESIDPTKMEVSIEEDNAENTNMDIDAIKDEDDEYSSMVHDEPSDNESSSNVGNISILNDSIVSNSSDRCATPVKMTPKQLQRRNESEKKKQEKELAKIERERKLQDEKEQRQREKEERELQKKREREEKGMKYFLFSNVWNERSNEEYFE